METQNRRSHARYPGEQLRVLVRSLNTENQDWVKGLISSVDFNRFGIGLETRHCFAIGEQVSMVIRTDDSGLSEINGVVCNRHKSELGFRCGIRFELSDNNEELQAIEEQAAATIH